MSKTYTSNDNGSKGIVTTSKRNEYEFSTSASYNARIKLQAFVGLLVIAAIVIFIVVKF